MNKIRALLQAKLAKYKMNPQYPSFSQIKHDALVSCKMQSNDQRSQLQKKERKKITIAHNYDDQISLLLTI